jgi:hypothetical protein
MPLLNPKSMVRSIPTRLNEMSSCGRYQWKCLFPKAPCQRYSKKEIMAFADVYCVAESNEDRLELLRVRQDLTFTITREAIALAWWEREERVEEARARQLKENGLRTSRQEQWVLC